MGGEFRLLGPLEVAVDGHAVDLGHGRQHCLLAVLLVEANRVVSTDELIDRAWGESQPRRAKDTLYSYLSRLRAALGGAASLVRRSGGYVLEVDPRAVDLNRFRALVREARSADDERAVASLGEALGLWRGDAFGGVDVPWLNGVRETLAAERFAAELDETDRRLRLGGHAELAVELPARVAGHPLNERLAAQFILTLYRCGRQADALAHFDEVRRRLADELGADPSPALRELHRQIMATDPELQPAAPITAVHQLPADIAEFTGREEQLRELMELAGSAVVTIEGMAGVGKTRLALRLAHRLTDRFDVFLYVDLHGFADQPPTDPAAALDSCLRLLGVPGEQIPHDLDGRAALYRDRLHGARALVVLDDAADERQVGPLLPACPTSLVLVTSRRTLALDGAHSMRLDVFRTDESIDLMAAIADPVRVAADPVGATEVTSLCGNLPLAVALAARRLRARPAWTMADLATRLRATGELSVGGRSVDAVFTLSYESLCEVRRRTFRLLALHPGEDFTEETAEVLTGSPDLESLVDEHLIGQTTPGRYHFHALLRRYARDLAGDESAAVLRLAAWYLASAAAADRLIDPHHRHLPASGDRTFRDRDDALRWMKAEQSNLVATVHTAASLGDHGTAWRLAAALWSFQFLGRYWDELRDTQHTALTSARRAGDAEGQAWTLNNSGVLHWQLHEHDRALDCYREALRLRRSLDDHIGQGVVLDNLGNAYDEVGRPDDAVECYREALVLAELTGDEAGQANVLSNLGETYRRTRRFTESLDHLNQALAIQRRIGDRQQRYTLCSLGELHDDLGDRSTAAAYYRDGLVLADQVGDRWISAVLLDKLGHAVSAAGDLVAAREHWKQATVLYAQVGDLQAAARLGPFLDGA
ncbi:AfsR/SARP family transcriptional regulator [Lentzea tibetensis]|uniref:AfsR/SARP family transcriptional regulator n=1 Tax=Lentzea tibetensis TaxID=2591470 RepID=UPI0016455939|nr:AfsR/SARP family transcriptional regulator [Lentzea tibetensis]